MSSLERTSSLFAHVDLTQYRSSINPATYGLLLHSARRGNIYMLDEPNIALLEAYYLTPATDGVLESIHEWPKPYRLQILSNLDLLFNNAPFRPASRRITVQLADKPEGENALFHYGQYNFSHIIGRYPNLAKSLGFESVRDIFPKINPEALATIPDPYESDNSTKAEDRAADDENYRYALENRLFDRMIQSGLLTTDELKEIEKYYFKKKSAPPHQSLRRFSIALARVANNLD